MKKQNKFMEFLNSRGFYTALFTCLFAVLAIAAFVSIKNIDAITKLNTVNPAADPTYGEKQPSLENGAAAVDVRTTEPVETIKSEKNEASIITEKPAAKDGAKTNDSAKTKQEATKMQSKPESDSANDQKTEQTQTELKTQQKTDVKAEQNEDQKAEQNKDQKPEQTKAEETEIKTEQPKEQSQPLQNKEPQTQQSSAAQSSAFADTDKMNWPLDGAIVMNFSSDRAIYDKTLDQYRTNPTISISADSGTQVKAAADGIVKAITIDPRTGYTVLVDHGGGWETKYGQLQSTVLVKEGQSVTAGQAIGGVGNPTKYGSLLGPHLVFGITKDDVPKDPQLVLEK